MEIEDMEIEENNGSNYSEDGNHEDGNYEDQESESPMSEEDANELSSSQDPAADEGSSVHDLFEHIRRLNSQVGEWTCKTNELLALSLEKKTALLLHLGRDVSADAAEGQKIDRLIIELLVSPAIRHFISKAPDVAVELLDRYIKDVKTKAQERQNKDNEQNQKIAPALYAVVMVHYDRILDRFNKLYASSTELKSLKAVVSKHPKKPNLWYPFLSPRSVCRFVELDEKGEPLVINYGNSDASSRIEVLRDASNVDEKEIDAILRAIDGECALIIERASDKRRGVTKVSSLSPRIVDSAITSLMRAGMLPEVEKRRVKASSDGVDADDANPGATKSKTPEANPRQIPSKYEACKLLGDENCSDFIPTALPTYWSENGMEKDDDILAQSYGVVKLGRKLNDSGIPLDISTDSGRKLRMCLGLDPYRSSAAKRMTVSVIHLVTPAGVKDLEEQKAKGEKLAAAAAVKASPTAKRKKKRKGSKPAPVLKPRKFRQHVVAPVAMHFQNPICDDLRLAIVAKQNSVPWIVDTASKSHRRSMRCPFQSDCYSKHKQMPLIPLGSNRAVLATPADDFDICLFNFISDYSNMPINAINYVKQQMWENLEVPQHNPVPSVGIPFQDYLRYLDQMTLVNPDFFSPVDGMFVLNPPRSEYQYWRTTSVPIPLAPPGVSRATSPVGGPAMLGNAPPNNKGPPSALYEHILGSDSTNSEDSKNSVGEARRKRLKISNDSRTNYGGKAIQRSTSNSSDNSDSDKRSLSSSVSEPIPQVAVGGERRRGKTFVARPYLCPDLLPNQRPNLGVNQAAMDLGSYFWHQDAMQGRNGGLVSKPGLPVYTKDANGEFDLPLPMRKVMIILTQILGDDSMNGAKTFVDWVKYDLGKAWMGGLVTGICDWHIQCVGVQHFNNYHAAAAFQGTIPQGFTGARLIMTFRFILDPNKDDIAFLRGAFLDKLLPKQISDRAALTILSHHSKVNVISGRRDLPQKDLPKKLALEDLCIMKWKEAQDFTEDNAGLDTDVQLLPGSISPTRKATKVEPEQKLVGLAVEQLAYFQKERIPLRDTEQESLLLSQRIAAFDAGVSCSNDSQCITPSPRSTSPSSSDISNFHGASFLPVITADNMSTPGLLNTGERSCFVNVTLHWLDCITGSVSCERLADVAKRLEGGGLTKEVMRRMLEIVISMKTKRPVARISLAKLQHSIKKAGLIDFGENNRADGSSDELSDVVLAQLDNCLPEMQEKLSFVVEYKRQCKTCCSSTETERQSMKVMMLSSRREIGNTIEKQPSLVECHESYMAGENLLIMCSGTCGETVWHLQTKAMISSPPEILNLRLHRQRPDGKPGRNYDSVSVPSEMKFCGGENSYSYRLDFVANHVSTVDTVDYLGVDRSHLYCIKKIDGAFWKYDDSQVTFFGQSDKIEECLMKNVSDSDNRTTSGLAYAYVYKRVDGTQTATHTTPTRFPGIPTNAVTPDNGVQITIGNKAPEAAYLLDGNFSDTTALPVPPSPPDTSLEEYTRNLDDALTTLPQQTAKANAFLGNETNLYPSSTQPYLQDQPVAASIGQANLSVTAQTQLLTPPACLLSLLINAHQRLSLQKTQCCESSRTDCGTESDETSAQNTITLPISYFVGNKFHRLEDIDTCLEEYFSSTISEHRCRKNNCMIERVLSLRPPEPEYLLLQLGRSPSEAMQQSNRAECDGANNRLGADDCCWAAEYDTAATCGRDMHPVKILESFHRKEISPAHYQLEFVGMCTKSPGADETGYVFQYVEREGNAYACYDAAKNKVWKRQFDELGEILSGKLPCLYVYRKIDALNAAQVQLTQESPDVDLHRSGEQATNNGFTPPQSHSARSASTPAAATLPLDGTQSNLSQRTTLTKSRSDPSPMVDSSSGPTTQVAAASALSSGCPGPISASTGVSNKPSPTATTSSPISCTRPSATIDVADAVKLMSREFIAAPQVIDSSKHIFNCNPSLVKVPSGDNDSMTAVANVDPTQCVRGFLDSPFGCPASILVIQGPTDASASSPPNPTCAATAISGSVTATNGASTDDERYDASGSVHSTFKASDPSPTLVANPVFASVPAIIHIKTKEGANFASGPPSSILCDAGNSLDAAGGENLVHYICRDDGPIPRGGFLSMLDASAKGRDHSDDVDDSSSASRPPSITWRHDFDDSSTESDWSKNRRLKPCAIQGPIQACPPSPVLGLTPFHISVPAIIHVKTKRGANHASGGPPSSNADATGNSEQTCDSQEGTGSHDESDTGNLSEIELECPGEPSLANASIETNSEQDIFQPPVPPLMKTVAGCLKARRTAQIPDKAATAALHYIVQETALNAGQIIEVVDKDGTPGPATIFTLKGRPVAGGTELSISEIPVLQTKSNHKPTDKKNPSCFVISRGYKQLALERLLFHINYQVVSSLAASQPIKKACRTDMRDEDDDRSDEGDVSQEDFEARLDELCQEYAPLYNDCHRNPLPATGTGGSTQAEGARACQLHSTRSDKAHFTVGTGQAMGDETNAILNANDENQRVVGMILNVKPFLNEKKKSARKNRERKKEVKKVWLPLPPRADGELPEAVFIGNYRPVSYEKKRDGWSDLLDSRHTIAKLSGELQNHTYKMFGRLTCYYVPAFCLRTDLRLKLRFYHQKDFIYKKVQVSHQDRRTIKAEVFLSQKLIMKQALDLSSDPEPNKFWPLRDLQNPVKDKAWLTELAGQRYATKAKKHAKGKGKEFDFAAAKAGFKLSEERPDLIPDVLCSRESVLGVLVQQNDFIEKKIEWNGEAEKKSQSSGYRVTVPQAMNVMLAVACHQAIRAFNRKRCTISVEEMHARCGGGHNRSPNELYAVPIIDDLDYDRIAPALPMHRIRPTPTERDLDVSTNCVVNELETTAKALRGTNQAPPLPKSGLSTYELDDGGQAPAGEPIEFGRGHDSSKIEADAAGYLEFLLTAIWKSTLFRFTGNSDMLERYSKWKSMNESSCEQNLPMNNVEALRNWGLFISDQLGGLEDKSTSTFMSKQHQKMIPKELRDSMKTMLTFFHRLLPELQVQADSERGCDGLVTKQLKVMLVQNVHQRSRKDLLYALVHAISNAGAFQQEQKLYEIAHQIVLDVETFYLDFAGPTRLDNVYAGFGGREGLSLIDFVAEQGAQDDRVKTIEDLNKGRASDRMFHERLHELHEQYTLLIRGDRRIRRVFNLVIDTKGVLRNRLSGRKFTFSDSEHKPCCKLSNATRGADPSRTISEAPRSFSNYTYPRSNPKEWDEALHPTFRNIFAAYCQLPAHAREIPPQYTPDGASHVDEHEFTMVNGAAQDGTYSMHDSDEEEDMYSDDFDNLDQDEDRSSGSEPSTIGSNEDDGDSDDADDAEAGGSTHQDCDSSLHLTAPTYHDLFSF